MVTGGAGFIGSTLVDRLLAEGHAVDVVDDLSTGSLTNLADARSGSTNDMTFHHVDIRSPQLVDLMARRPPEVVFHLAAQADVRVSVDDPVLDADINILGSLRVLEGARRAGVSKIVFAASGGTLYGDVRPSDLPARESLPRVPTSPYGISKMVVVDYLTAYRELHNIEFCALALGNVYGPRQDPHGEAGVVAIFAGRLLGGERCTIFGDGSQTRDFVFVDDVVDAMARAGQRGGGLLINVGTGTETSVLQLYETMARGAGSSQWPVHAPPRPGELQRSALDPGRAAIHLGWKPWTTLADGTAAVLEAASPDAADGGGGRPVKGGRGSTQRKRSSR
jgi:UDP-glucose 4-epimerase